MLQPPKKVLCLMDLSLAGRASLAVVLPVLAACGVQACPLPAALFSTHTGGFGSVVRQDEADFCHNALEHFKREKIDFDAVYVGYLFGEKQFALAEAALAQYPNALHLVDPALGDGGKVYNGLGEENVQRMKALCQKARLITPNVTESALLLDEDPEKALVGAQAMEIRLAKLAGESCSVLVTSVPNGSGFEMMGCGPGGRDFFRIPSHHVNQHYPGTGDLMTSALCGLLLSRGDKNLKKAAELAGAFVETAAKATYEGGGNPRNGLWFEPFLPMLHPGETGWD